MSNGLPNLGVELLGDSNSFVQAMGQAQSALKSLEAKTAGIGSAVASAFQKIVAPVGLAVAGAFASQKALSAFASSKLPGAAEFTETLDKAKTALQNLAASVGEFLAPSAARVAKITTSIAEALTPIVRKFTALTASAGEFLTKLGSNFAAAFGALVPTAGAAIDKIMEWWNRPSDWAGIFDAIRQKWNDTWQAVLDYTAPILVSIGSMIEASLRAATEIWGELSAAAGEAFDWIGAKIAEVFPPGEGGFAARVAELADTFQGQLVTAIQIAEAAITNWRATAEVAWEGAKVGFTTVVGEITNAWDQLPANFEVIGNNIGKVFDGVVAYIRSAFDSLALYVQAKMAVAANNATANIPFLGDGKIMEQPKFAGAAPFRIQEFEALPGIKPRDIPPEENDQRKKFGDLFDNFKKGIDAFLGNNADGLGGAVDAFKKKILEGLPDFKGNVMDAFGKIDAFDWNGPKVDAKPIVPKAEFGAPRERYAAFAEAGTQQGYQQALRALGQGGMEVERQQLHVLNRIAGGIDRINTKPAPDVVKI